MAGHGADISWDLLRQIVQAWAGTSAELKEVATLEGGMVNTTVALTLGDGRKAVLKLTQHRVDRAHADEAIQLELLKDVGVPVPEVYSWQVGTLDSPFSFILMEFVEGVDLAAAKATCAAEQYDALQQHLAELVLRLHERTGPCFMRVCRGETKQHERWPAFYRDVFDPIWREVEKSTALPVKCRKTIARVHDRLDTLLAHDDRPRLLHWDIWSTNLLARCDGNDGDPWRISAMLDPNCKFGHAEAELAYMELFHTCTPAFMRAYQQARKLPPEYHRVRRPVYQLYTLINHVRLFGQEYLKRLLEAVERVSPLV
jgi:fructosamine-3-kinase